MFVSSKLTEDPHRCYSCKLCRNSRRAHVHDKHQLRATPAGGSMCRDVSASSAGWTRELTQWWGSYGGAVEVGAAAAAAAPADTLDIGWLRHGDLAEELRAAWAPGITSAWPCAAVRPGDSLCGRQRETPTDLFWSLRYRSVCPITLKVIAWTVRKRFIQHCIEQNTKTEQNSARWWLEPVEWTLAGAEHLRIFSCVRWLLFWCAILRHPYMVKVERQCEAEGSYHSKRFITTNTRTERKTSA